MEYQAFPAGPKASVLKTGVSMKAILCSQYCQPDDLVLADVPDPVAGPDEAVIAIKAAALNFFDILMIQGKYQIKPPFPFSPAAEIAGVVESVGAGVTDLKVGDRVVASCGHNGAREKITLPASSIVKIPDNLDFDRAAGIIIIYGTALHALEDRASPKPGETLAVLGAAGGTGLAACELGKLMGLKVIACASSDEKLEFAKAHGAELTLNYSKEDLKEGLRRLTGGKGANVAIDTGGTAASIRQSVDVLRKGGRVAFTGVPTEGDTALPMQKIVLEEIDLYGVRANRNTMEEVIPLIVSGRVRVKPLVTHTFRLEDYGQALHTFAERIDGALKVLVQPG
jgi:NADPH2:quinone reductase